MCSYIWLGLRIVPYPKVSPQMEPLVKCPIRVVFSEPIAHSLYFSNDGILWEWFLILKIAKSRSKPEIMNGAAQQILFGENKSK